MKTTAVLFTLYRFNAFTDLVRDGAAGLRRACCRGERIPLDAGTPCEIIARVSDRVLIQLHNPMDGRPLYGWTEINNLL